jgi:hypothetical protein
MSDDSFIREVNEELRQDKARALWDRYGMLAIGAAIAILLATGAYVAWEYWTTTRANQSGDAFSQALNLAEQGESEAALAALQELEEEGYGAYPVLARLRSATVAARAGDAQGAVAAFDAVANDGSVPQPIRDVARLRAGYLLVDHGSYEDVAARVEGMTADENAMRHSAREALGLAAWKDGQGEEAMRLFQLILDDAAAPPALRQRARLMTELIRGSQGT